MKILYADNFRGFKNTCIPLKDVNFFLGENSTGKTSILSLINLISNINFWTFRPSSKPSFNIEEIKLGHYNDIVSAKASDKSYFRFGFSDSDETIIKAILLTFKDENGTPTTSEMRVLTDSFDINIYIKRKTIKYCYKKPFVTDLNSETLFKKWARRSKVNKLRTCKTENISPASSLTIIINAVIEELTNKKAKEKRHVIPTLYDHLAWLAPIRAKALRTYDEYDFEFSPEGTHAPYLLKKYLLARPSRFKIKFITYLKKFGKESGLFEDIRVIPYGKDEVSPFELDIVLKKYLYKLSNVGYGISQVLPIITEIIARMKDACVIIQQPEIHLHPKAQAALGSMIYDAYKKENKKFLIETHSDFLIDRFRIKLNHDRSKRKPLSQVLYFQNSKVGNKVYPIDIMSDGSYSKKQPVSFRSFFIREQLELLKI